MQSNLSHATILFWTVLFFVESTDGLGLGGFIEVAMICFLNIVGGSRASILVEKTDNKIRAAGGRIRKLSLDFQP